MKPDIRTRRVYDAPQPDDGCRVLVDRLWPRGLSKARVAADHWYKTLAPSTELRRWFGHDPARWQEFKKRYAAELRKHPEALKALRALAAKGPLTLLYAAKDRDHNQAVALRQLLLDQAG